jgi:hypothetical protein
MLYSDKPAVISVLILYWNILGQNIVNIAKTKLFSTRPSCQNYSGTEIILLCSVHFFPLCKDFCGMGLIVCEVTFSFFPFWGSCSYELMIWSFQCTLLRDNVFVEGICIGKGLLDSDGLGGVKDGKPFNEEMSRRKECWNYQSALQQPCVNWYSIFDIMHQISTRITEENVRVQAVSIMILLFQRSTAYFERET